MAEGDPVGMVDRLPEEAGGPTEEGMAFARAYLADGEMDPAVVARIMDPDAAAERQRLAAEKKTRDWPALGYYRAANAALADARADVVFIGDSITEMWAVSQPDLFTGGVVNRGISGQTSPQILLRFMADVVALKPRAVHILCGANDVAGNTGPTTPEDYQRNVIAMTDLAQANGIAVILAGMTPVTSFTWAPLVQNPRERVIALNRWLADAAAERGLIHADYAAVLADADGALNPDLTRDGVHPTSRGYAVMRPIGEGAIATALQQVYR